LLTISVTCRFFPIAMGIVSHGNEANWSWFLFHLKEMIHEDLSLVFMSDRQWGLILGVQNFFSYFLS